MLTGRDHGHGCQEGFGAKPEIDLIFLDTSTTSRGDPQRRACSTTLPQLKMRLQACRLRNHSRLRGQARQTSVKRTTVRCRCQVEPASRRATANSMSRQSSLWPVIHTRRQARHFIDIVEVDDQGLIKVNPLANWSFKGSSGLHQENNVPASSLSTKATAASVTGAQLNP